ncbi:MAG: ribonuclease HI, partial [Prolixibacteraceae bacterium]|nr:ribonuclease HI [Prolixibacteraceae bacterium]
DLWIRYLDVSKKHTVRFVWVKGHANIPENERCDRLAVEASEAPGLLTDEGYNIEQ